MQQEVYMTTFFATAPLVGILFEVLRIVVFSDGHGNKSWWVLSTNCETALL